MGHILSKILWFWTPVGYDDPDPATGLTPRQKEIVQSTWKIIRADGKKNGIKLFLMFFDKFPEYQSKFKAFADVPRDELPKNGRLAAHAVSVLYALNSVVDNVQDPECLVELLTKVGVSHKSRNLSSQHFLNLAEVMIVFLEDTLGKNVMDDSAKLAWQKTLEVANSVILKELE